MSSSSVYIHHGSSAHVSKNLIVAFGGMQKGMGSVRTFEFLNFLKSNFPTIDQHFYIDAHQTWYHKGIPDISNDIESTADYLRNQIVAYEHVIFIGVSAGGYAAILFGSLLSVSTVISFVPQTILSPTEQTDQKYLDISHYINHTTSYYIYGDSKASGHLHNFHHCQRLKDYSNVHIMDIPMLNLPSMCGDGSLYNLLEPHVVNDDVL